MDLIDMKSTVKAEGSTLMAPVEREEYPYGLRLTLDNDALAKLGMTELPAIDREFKLMALCCVVAVSQSERADGEPYRSVELQVEQMALVPAEEESGESSDDAASRMYPSMRT